MNANLTMATNSVHTPVQAAWARFQAMADEMRVKMESTSRFRDNPQNRAKAYYTLLEAQAMAYNFVVAPRLDHPRIQVETGWQSHFYTLGQNGMDLYYGVAFLDGKRSYRISGRMGDLRLMLLQVLSGLPGRPESKTVGNYDFDQFKKGKDGYFSIVMSATQGDGDHIALLPDSGYHFVLIRRLMGDWLDDPGELTIEMLDPPPDHSYDHDDFDEATMSARIDRAADFVRYLVEQFNINLYDMYLKQAGGKKNTLGLLPGVVTSEVGNPVSNYAMGIFELEPDEALIVELPQPPKSAYWSFQLGDVWSRSLDFWNYQTDVNMTHAAMDADGGFRAVIANHDPGIANWMDTRNRSEGTIVFRNYRSADQPIPSVRKVKFSELAKYLPPGTRRVTPAERAAALARRRAGFFKLHGE